MATMLRNRFLGAYDAAIIATFPAAIQKFIADGQVEDPVFMDAYLTEVLALPNPYDRILKDLADAFVEIDATDFAAAGLSGLGSIGSIFKKIVKAVVSIHQKLFAGLKASVRVTERVWHKYGNVILSVIGGILAPFTFGISTAVAAVLVTANTMYQKQVAVAKAKEKSKEAEDAAIAEAAAYTAETERQVDQFYFTNQQWFVDNLDVGPDKWGRLNLDLKIKLLQAGNTGVLPPDAFAIKAELLPVYDLYQYGPVVLRIAGPDQILPAPPDHPVIGAKSISYANIGSQTDPGYLIKRYDTWLQPMARGLRPRNTSYFGDRTVAVKGGRTFNLAYIDSDRSLLEDLASLIASSKSPMPWFIRNWGLTPDLWSQLSIDEKFGALRAAEMNGTRRAMPIPSGAKKIGIAYGDPVASMDIAPPPTVQSPQQPPSTSIQEAIKGIVAAPAEPQIKVTVPGASPAPVYTGPVTPTAQAAINQAAQAAAVNVSAGVPWSQAVQGAVQGLLSTVTSPGTAPKPTQVATAGMFDGVGVPLVIAGIVLAAVFGKPVPARRTRRNPRRRHRRVA